MAVCYFCGKVDHDKQILIRVRGYEHEWAHPPCYHEWKTKGELELAEKISKERHYIACRRARRWRRLFRFLKWLGS